MEIFVNGLAFLIHRVTGMSVSSDQLSILVSLLLSLNGALVFKHIINPSDLSKQYKLAFTTILGVWLFFSNWGWIISIPICEVLISYLLFKFLPIEKAYKWVFAISMTGLSIGNLLIVYTKYNALTSEFTADFTGTIMVMTQRLTSYSCSLYDGLAVKEEELSDARKRNAIKKMPSFVEFFSYMFNFFGILVGPLVFYNDFMKVFEEKNASKSVSKAPVVRKLISGLTMVVIFVLGTRIFDYKLNADGDFMESNPLWFRLGFLYISLFAVRAKYYGVWLLGDSIFNAAGIGFTGFDSSGTELWDGVSNINIPEIELASGMKSYIDNWNIMTVKWIRLVSYDRMPASVRTIASFGLSAFWHGFFPGYYIMFATCHIYLLVQRKWRRMYRARFRSGKWRRMAYEVITFLITQLSIAYSVVPFVLLEWTASIKFYSSLWYVGHVIGLFALLLLSVQSSRNDEDSATPKVQNLKNISNGHHHTAKID